MARIVFHEKSGCATNSRQKAVLSAAGHVVEARDLRATAWDAAQLRAFLGPLPVAQWFNRNAPAIKHGELDPQALDEHTALQLLQANPLLIRRPLLEISEAGKTERLVGFDMNHLAPYLGTLPQAENAEACRHPHKPYPTPPQATVSPAPTVAAAEAAYLGLALGDALGATVEFMTPTEIRHVHGVHRDIVGGGWLRLRPGNVTDDTTMALALGEAILACGGRVEAQACAEHFVAWMCAKPVDIGNTVRRNLNDFRRSGRPVALVSDQDAGNGAAMRLLPAVLATLGDDEAGMVEAVLTQAHVTHNNPQSDAACLLLARCIRAAIGGAGLRELYRGLIQPFLVRHPEFDYRRRDCGNPSAYIVHTLRSVLRSLMLTDSFESCLIDIVNQGGDADTTAAIAGMIAGPLYGRTALPTRWLQALDAAIAARCCAQAHALLDVAFAPPSPVTCKETSRAAL